MNHNAIVNAAGQPTRARRGFEGLALTPEGGSPFIGREGPLDHPSRPEGVPHATGGRKEQHLACEARASLPRGSKNARREPYLVVKTGWRVRVRRKQYRRRR